MCIAVNCTLVVHEALWKCLDTLQSAVLLECVCVCPCLNIIIKGTKCWYFWILRQRLKKWFGVMVGVRGLGTSLCQSDALTKMWKRVCVCVCMTQKEIVVFVSKPAVVFDPLISLSLNNPQLLRAPVQAHECVCSHVPGCQRLVGVLKNYSYSCTYDTQLWEQNTSCSWAF